MTEMRWDFANNKFLFPDGVQINAELLTEAPYIIDSLDDERLSWLPREIVIALYEPWDPASHAESLGDMMSPWQGGMEIQDV